MIASSPAPALPRQLSAPTLGTALLLPQDRIARAPLDAWAGEILGRMRTCLAGVRSARAFSLDLAGVANNAALLAAHYGRTDVARVLCERQIRWHDRFGRRAGDPAMAARGLQPWINLGRLDAALGRWEAALERFARLSVYDQVRQLEFESVRVRCAGWGAVSESAEELGYWLENVRVVDSFKALLLNRRFAEAAEMAAAGEPFATERLARFAAETSIVAFGRLGDTDRAQEAARRAAGRVRGWERVIFRLRLAEALACGGRADEAAAILDALADVLLQLSPGAGADLQNLHVVFRVAAACREVGLDGTALALARRVREGGRVAGDELFQIEALRTLAALAPAPEREVWGDELARLEENTLHARYRRGGPAPPHPIVERLFAELGEVLAA